jgi:hypothetical protein
MSAGGISVIGGVCGRDGKARKLESGKFLTIIHRLPPSALT